MYRWLGYLLVSEVLYFCLVFSLPAFFLGAIGLLALWAMRYVPRRHRAAHHAALAWSWFVFFYGVTTLVAHGVAATVEPSTWSPDWAPVLPAMATLMGPAQLWALRREQRRDPSLQLRRRYAIARSSSWIALLALCTLVVTPRMFIQTNPWSKMDCGKVYVDIDSGYKKHEQYFWYSRFADAIEPTYLSRLLGKDLPTQPSWRATHTVTPAQGHSPHHRFHGALHQIDQLETVVTNYALPNPVARGYGTRVLELWQTHQSDAGVRGFLHSLHEKHAPSAGL